MHQLHTINKLVELLDSNTKKSIKLNIYQRWIVKRNRDYLKAKGYNILKQGKRVIIEKTIVPTSRPQIHLEFPTYISRLSGYDYGLQVYVEQIEPFVEVDKPYDIVFPEHIDKASTSFIYGMLDKYPYDFSEMFNVKGTYHLLKSYTRALDILEDDEDYVR